VGGGREGGGRGGGGEGGREYKYRIQIRYERIHRGRVIISGRGGGGGDETKVIVYTKFNVQYIGNCIRICNERGVSRIILIC
jgi:hypothetical protein